MVFPVYLFVFLTLGECPQFEDQHEAREWPLTHPQTAKRCVGE